MNCSSAKPSHNCLKLRPLVAALLTSFSVFAPQFSAAADSPKPDNSLLPDLGNPTQQNSATIRPGPGGIALKGTFDRQKFIVSPEYSDQTGLSFGAGFASMLGENAAVGVLLNVGSDKREYLLNAGFKLDERQRVIVTAGQLKQFLDYAFVSGTEKVGMTQNSAALSYQLQLGTEFLRFLEVNGYVAKTSSRDLADKTFAVDSATLYELWNDPRRIAGGKVAGLQGRLGFSPIEGSTVKISLGHERLSYDLLAGKDSVNRLTGGIEWLQQLPDHYNLKLAADTFASQNRYSAGIERVLNGVDGGRHSLGLNLVGIRGRDGLGNDNQAQLTYRYSFGTGAATQGRSGFNPAMSGTLAANGTTGQNAVPFGSRLLDQVAQRPSVIPSRVVAKVDQTALPTRLIAVNKTTLPASSTLDAATGDITTPLGVAVTGIAGVTRNGGAFANVSQFALSGNNLITRPSQFVQPAVGVVDTYVVTINNSGGGTTLATVLVSHGSVKIDSIVVTAGAVSDVTPPVTTSAPNIAIAATDTTVSVSQTINENGTGYYLILPVAAAAPTVAAVKAGTSFAMFAGIQAVANLTGLTASTSYKYYFVAKDSANNDQAVVSTGLPITTTAAAVTPSLSAALPNNGSSWGTGAVMDVTISSVTPGATWAVEDITPTGPNPLNPNNSGPAISWLSPTSGTGDVTVNYGVMPFTDGRWVTVRVTVSKNSLSQSYILTAQNPTW